MTRKERNQEAGSWLTFDFTINLPLILTLVLGFGSVVLTVVKIYFDHELRIYTLEDKEGRRVELEKKFDPGEVSKQQAIILNEIQHLNDSNRDQKDQLNALSNKIEFLFSKGVNAK